MSEIKSVDKSIKQKFSMLPNTAQLQKEIEIPYDYLNVQLAELPTANPTSYPDSGIGKHGKIGSPNTVYMREYEREAEGVFRTTGDKTDDLSGKPAKVKVGRVMQPEFSELENASRKAFETGGARTSDLSKKKSYGLNNALLYPTFKGMELKNTRKEADVKQ